MTLYKHHGLYKTPEHQAWSAMKHRCYNSNNSSYHRYGGRGIRVYEPWINDFKAFYDYIGPRPSDEYSIDRIDNDGHYEPGNVRWATREEQNHNKSTNIAIELADGNVVTAKEAAVITGLNRHTVYQRLKNNISLYERPRGLDVKYQDRFITWDELSSLHGIEAQLIKQRVWAGMDIELAISMPKQTTARYLYNDQYLTIPEIATIEGINRHLINKHIRDNIELRGDIQKVISFIKRKYDSGGNKTDMHCKHGMTGTAEHNTWNSLRFKCYNPNSPSYKNYGGQGVTICDRWRYSFPNFYEDMGPRPGSGYYLKILDKKKLIGPGNAEWATL